MVKRLLGAKTKLWSTTRVKGPFLSLILTIVFPDGITLICKIFAGDASLFSNVHDIDMCAKKIKF